MHELEKMKLCKLTRVLQFIVRCAGDVEDDTRTGLEFVDMVTIPGETRGSCKYSGKELRNYLLRYCASHVVSRRRAKKGKDTIEPKLVRSTRPALKPQEYDKMKDLVAKADHNAWLMDVFEHVEHVCFVRGLRLSCTIPEDMQMCR